MNQTAYKAAVTSTDRYGKPSYEAPVAVKVRVERLDRMVRNALGEDVPSSHKVWCLTALSITDRIWLPGANQADATQAKHPIAVSSVSDKVGARTLYEVTL
jgi:hypothetical protein